MRDLPFICCRWNIEVPLFQENSTLKNCKFYRCSRSFIICRNYFLQSVLLIFYFYGSYFKFKWNALRLLKALFHEKQLGNKYIWQHLFNYEMKKTHWLYKFEAASFFSNEYMSTVLFFKFEMCQFLSIFFANYQVTRQCYSYRQMRRYL